jgi:hypothetical protein
MKIKGKDDTIEVKPLYSTSIDEHDKLNDTFEFRFIQFQYVHLNDRFEAILFDVNKE